MACSTAQPEGEAPSEGAKDADVQAALARLPGAEVLGRQEGVPFLIRGELGRLTPSGVSAQRARADSGADAREALTDIAGAFRLRNDDLVFRRANVDAQGRKHLRFRQLHQGRPVIGGELVLHADAEGLIYAANGSARGGTTSATEPTVASDAARSAALAGTSIPRASAEGAPTLVYVRTDGSDELRLAWQVRLVGTREGMKADDLVYVDALRGGVVATHPQIHEALNRKVYSANNGSTTPGTLKRSEGQAATGDAHVDMNYDQLGNTYNCYKTLFNRDSYDNAGAQLTSTVHYGSNYVNAYWDGTQMVYGDGDGVDSIELGKDLDVTVHELTHAVTDTESDLIYSGESGGLNESMSDIFAGVCESWTRNWATDADVFMVGEDIWTPAIANDALRYMDDPAKDNSSLDFYGDYSSGVDVHYSSGISNLVFALLSKGGTHPRGKTTQAVAAIGPEKAGRIFYKANTDLFTPSTTFEQAKAYTVQAAQDLGYDAATVQAVTNAWLAVGVPPPPPVTNPLTNGVPVTGLSGSSGNKKYYTLEVPAGVPTLTFTTTGGTGDADLYVRFGSVPNSGTYDCRPYASGNAETCTFNNPQAGTWYVMVNAYTTYSGVTLTGTHSGGGTGTPTTETATGTVTRNENDNFGPYNVVPGTSFTVTMTGTRNPNLYVRFGAAPTTTTYDCRPNTSGASETCTLTVPSGQSAAHVMVRGAGSQTASYNLTIKYTKP
ncbi:M4 family metallopeptidase [Myxococcus landrumensis]|uniref:M4 family metallopeptidase n=1 Tax=Myxococcus landrumensis TaxID=2813577 RepID=UPI001F50BD78|nr:M4 family metallopeptidase [Myxococcus landrumus]